MLSCKEIAQTVSTEDVVPVGWRKRLALKLHLMMCRHCRRYAQQMQAMGNAARDVFQHPPKDPSSPETPQNLAKLQSAILDRLAPPWKQLDSDD
jgi:anti-sigma factor ChrR (cupin superfamily)